MLCRSLKHVERHASSRVDEHLVVPAIAEFRYKSLEGRVLDANDVAVGVVVDLAEARGGR